MILQHQVVTISIGLLFMALVLNLLRKRAMRETYSILWLVMSIIFILVSSWETMLERLTVFMGARYPASVLFFLGLIFVMIFLVHYSVELSSLRKQNISLNQAVAILQEKLDHLAGTAPRGKL